ncbi:site-specific recombinase, phage integrase family [Acetobacteraceae bacterium AT-5844]|nr:site-specific recombinase, phage integrase family [Acetobacteraceae bacterium AT-5844]
MSLGADQSAAWDAARALNKRHLELRDDQPVPGTVAWLFRQFEASDRFGKLANGTQRDYRWLAKLLEAHPVGNTTLGRLPAMAIKPRHADGIFAELFQSNGHHAAHYACRYARRVWKWAARREHVGPVNPWSGMELPSLPARRARWTPEQVIAVVAAAKEANRPSLGLATLLAYWLGHRQGDILSLTWEDIEAGHKVTSKTGATLPLAVSVYPELAVALESARQDGGPVVRKESTGRAYQRHTFGHEWRELATKAGIPEALQFRDLRATAATEMADGGADVIEMSSHTGHRDVKMARRYARPTAAQAEGAAKKRLAAQNRARETALSTGKLPKVRDLEDVE